MPTERLRRIQRLFGLTPLALFLLVHLWEHAPIDEGRSGVLERLYTRFEGLPVWLEALWLLGALGVQVGTTLVLQLRARADEVAAAARARRRNAGLAGLVALAFLLWHLGSVWLPARGLGGGPLTAMALAEAQLDDLVGALAYVLGWSGVVLVLGYAQLSPPGVGPVAVDSRRPLWALVAGALLWLWGVDLLASYVAGAGVF